MKVRALFYAQLRDVAATPHLNVDLTEGAAISDLLAEIYERIPALRAHDKSILTGAGVEFVDQNYKLKAGEEIAIMPPVQGG
jgi:molybdopterin converting factor small subunit